RWVVRVLPGQGLWGEWSEVASARRGASVNLAGAVPTQWRCPAGPDPELPDDVRRRLGASPAVSSGDGAGVTWLCLPFCLHVLEYHPEGARLVRDEPLQQWTFRRRARFLSRLFAREKSPAAAGVGDGSRSRHACSASMRTRAVPRATMPSTRAAPYETSSDRPGP